RSPSPSPTAGQAKEHNNNENASYTLNETDPIGCISERVVVLAERRSTRRFAEYLAFYRSANTGDYLLWIAGMAHHHLWDWAGAPQPDQTKHQPLMMNVSIFQEQGS
ncbi:hypothetical protein, partial [Bifidobacterium longum]|uniref:hypothetical protein n=1 Tax=Bifidobacterium longum TaxID=216816 RepID=UPI002023F8D2